MDLLERHRVRRHLSASPSRGERKSPRGIGHSPSELQFRKAHKKTGPRGPVFSSLLRAASIVAAIEAVMVVVVMMVVTVSIPGRHDDHARPVSAIIAVMMMVMMVVVVVVVVIELS